MITLRKASRARRRPVRFTVGNTRFIPAVELTKSFRSPEGGKQYRTQSQTYVATPAVLEYLGIDPTTIDPGADFLVDRGVTAKDMVIPSFSSRTEIHVTNVQKIDIGQHLFGAASGRNAAVLHHPQWSSPPWLEADSRPAGSSSRAGP